MRNKKLSLFLFPLAVVSAGLLSSCDDASNTVVLRILNAEDYIYEYEDGDEEYGEDGENWYKMDMLDQYKLDWESRPENKGKTLDIVYDTFDTNETMFNELQTGKTTYDIVVPSDYMVQKLASKGMLQKLIHKDDLWDKVSPYISDSMSKVGILGTEDTINDYCIPYMWGTLGVMYNPNYYETNFGLEEDYVHDLFKSWDSLYGEELSNTFSIKDSVRDTFTICMLHSQSELVKEIVNNNEFDATSEELSKVINIVDANDKEAIAEFIKKAELDMEQLKANAFGFECDSGKTDMTTEKIGANLCWSGDATWAITEAEDNGLELYYSIPIGDNEENWSASNIWFDCFAMPKNHEGGDENISEAQMYQYELAEDFISFMSEPINAAQNCYCVGYTPAVAGDDMLDYMLGEYESSAAIEAYQDELDNLDPADFDTFMDYLKYRKELQTAIKDEKAYYEENKDNEEMYYDLRYFFDDENAFFLPKLGSVGRQLTAQYPNAKDLNRLAIMRDFGDIGNQALLDMWERVRTNPLPTWAIVLFIVEGVAVVAFAIYLVSKPMKRKKNKKTRN